MIWGDSFGYGDRGSRILYLSFSLLDALIIFLYYVFQSLYLSIQYLHLCTDSFHISQLLLFHRQFTLFILDFLLQSSYLSLISFIQFNSLSIIRISFVTWLCLLMTQSFIQLQGDMLALLWITATAHGIINKKYKSYHTNYSFTVDYFISNDDNHQMPKFYQDKSRLNLLNAVQLYHPNKTKILRSMSTILQKRQIVISYRQPARFKQAIPL